MKFAYMIVRDMAGYFTGDAAIIIYLTVNDGFRQSPASCPDVPDNSRITYTLLKWSSYFDITTDNRFLTHDDS